MPVNDIMIGALSIYFGKDYDLPVFTPSFEVSEEDLESYTGVYSTPSFPLKITITRKGKTLIAQATGQPSFPLEATARHAFKFDQAGLTMEFMPTDNKMSFKQGGMAFELTKE
jgi:D-alanyl-D-alanine carboxypeptidase